MLSGLFTKSIEQYSVLPTNFSCQECRRRIKIVVIDDEGIDDALKRVLYNNGFIIDELYDVSAVAQLQAYSVILCDIKGIGTDISPEYQGAGLLKAIRDEYPTKYLISFTGSDIDRRYNNLLRNADDSITKDAEKQEWIEKLDRSVQNSLDPKKQWNRIRTYLSESKVPTSMIVKLEDNYVRHLQDPEVPFPSQKCAKTLPDNITRVLQEIIIPLAIKGATS